MDKKDKKITLRLSNKRKERFKEYSQLRDKAMTELMEDWIDSLPLEELRNSLMKDN